MASSRIRSTKDDVESMCLSTRRVTIVWFRTKVKREMRLTSLRRILKSNLKRLGKITGEQYRIRGRMRVSMEKDKSFSRNSSFSKPRKGEAYIEAPVKN